MGWFDSSRIVAPTLAAMRCLQRVKFGPLRATICSMFDTSASLLCSGQRPVCEIDPTSSLGRPQTRQQAGWKCGLFKRTKRIARRVSQKGAGSPHPGSRLACGATYAYGGGMKLTTTGSIL